MCYSVLEQMGKQPTKGNKMNTKTYLQIKSVTMANSDHIESVGFHPAPELKDVTSDDGNIDKASLLRTKASVIEQAYSVVVGGYGNLAGRTIEQLPTRIINQIRWELEKVVL